MIRLIASTTLHQRSGFRGGARAAAGDRALRAVTPAGINDVVRLTAAPPIVQCEVIGGVAYRA